MRGWSGRLRGLVVELRQDPIRRYVWYARILLAIVLLNVALLVAYWQGWL